MADHADTKLRMRAIRRLARPFPPASAGGRLKEISDIAKGGKIPERSGKPHFKTAEAPKATRRNRMQSPTPDDDGS